MIETKMKELFDVKFNPIGEGFEMNLINGTLKIPDKRDCYVLSTGCGSGKTECCKSIIRQKADEGILYCVDTISELDKMYNWITQNANELGITQDEVIIISSDKRHEHFLWQYQNNPEILMYKKIVLITHVRFWTDLINYFLIFNPKSKVEEFDGDFQRLMQRSDLRRYVIFDETPRFIQPFFTMDRCHLPAFSYMDQNGHIQCYQSSIIKNLYNKFFKNQPSSPFPKSNTVISEIKRNVIFKMIPEYFNQWESSTDKIIGISFTPLHLAQQQINTYVIILEGAGNVLFEGSQYYKLKDIKYKYNCKIDFTPFLFSLKRRDDNFDYGLFHNFIANCNSQIKYNQEQGKKTLLVVWKNYGNKPSDSNSTDYYDMVVNALSNNTSLDKEMYKVIYYGSSESKSTNDFRDFHEIILAGKWSIPNTDTQKFKTSFGVEIDNNRHRLWAFIQLLCRIGIRLHDGRKYSVYYSADYPTNFIKELKDYLENKDLMPLQVPSSTIPEWLEGRFERSKIRSNLRDQIIKLGKLNDWLMHSLQSETNFSFRITLNELYEIIPKDRKKRDKYGALVKALKKLGVDLRII